MFFKENVFFMLESAKGCKIILRVPALFIAFVFICHCNLRWLSHFIFALNEP